MAASFFQGQSFDVALMMPIPRQEGNRTARRSREKLPVTRKSGEGIGFDRKIRRKWSRGGTKKRKGDRFDFESN